MENLVKIRMPWSPTQHPRYPKGTPGGLGGRFMPKPGERVVAAAPTGSAGFPPVRGKLLRYDKDKKAVIEADNGVVSRVPIALVRPDRGRRRGEQRLDGPASEFRRPWNARGKSRFGPTMRANEADVGDVISRQWAGPNAQYEVTDVRDGQVMVRNVDSGMRAKIRPNEPVQRVIFDEEAVKVGDDVALAAKLLGEGKAIELDQERTVSTLLDRLADIVDEAEAKGADAPNYDLCKVTVKGTNIFCEEHLGIPRVRMPQLKGVPLKGSKADKMKRDSRGEVDLADEFMKEMNSLGVMANEDRTKAALLRASQRELNGGKIAKFKSLRDRGVKLEGNIIVSKDDYVVDGHHRWATEVGVDAEDGDLEDIEVDVLRIDKDIVWVLNQAKKFAAEWGIPQADIGGGFGKKKSKKVGAPPIVSPEGGVKKAYEYDLSPCPTCGSDDVEKAGRPQPRWPKGSPYGWGGRWMRIGQLVTLPNGKQAKITGFDDNGKIVVQGEDGSRMVFDPSLFGGTGGILPAPPQAGDRVRIKESGNVLGDARGRLGEVIGPTRGGQIRVKLDGESRPRRFDVRNIEPAPDAKTLLEERGELPPDSMRGAPPGIRAAAEGTPSPDEPFAEPNEGTPSPDEPLLGVPLDIGAVAPARAGERAPIWRIPVGAQVRMFDGRVGKVGRPQMQADGRMVGRYWDGQQWDYVEADTDFDVASVPEGKDIFKGWEKDPTVKLALAMGAPAKADVPAPRGPGRGPGGNLRNFKAMNDDKFLEVLGRLEAGGDPKALQAAREEADRRFPEASRIPVAPAVVPANPSPQELYDRGLITDEERMRAEAIIGRNKVRMRGVYIDGKEYERVERGGPWREVGGGLEQGQPGWKPDNQIAIAIATGRQPKIGDRVRAVPGLPPGEIKAVMGKDGFVDWEDDEGYRVNGVAIENIVEWDVDRPDEQTAPELAGFKAGDKVEVIAGARGPVAWEARVVAVRPEENVVVVEDKDFGEQFMANPMQLRGLGALAIDNLPDEAFDQLAGDQDEEDQMVNKIAGRIAGYDEVFARVKFVRNRDGLWNSEDRGIPGARVPEQLWTDREMAQEIARNHPPRGADVRAGDKMDGIVGGEIDADGMIKVRDKDNPEKLQDWPADELEEQPWPEDAVVIPEGMLPKQNGGAYFRDGDGKWKLAEAKGIIADADLVLLENPERGDYRWRKRDEVFAQRPYGVDEGGRKLMLGDLVVTPGGNQRAVLGFGSPPNGGGDVARINVNGEDKWFRQDKLRRADAAVVPRPKPQGQTGPMPRAADPVGPAPNEIDWLDDAGIRQGDMVLTRGGRLAQARGVMNDAGAVRVEIQQDPGRWQIRRLKADRLKDAPLDKIYERQLRGADRAWVFDKVWQRDANDRKMWVPVENTPGLLDDKQMALAVVTEMPRAGDEVELMGIRGDWAPGGVVQGVRRRRGQVLVKGADDRPRAFWPWKIRAVQKAPQEIGPGVNVRFRRGGQEGVVLGFGKAHKGPKWDRRTRATRLVRVKMGDGKVRRVLEDGLEIVRPGAGAGQDRRRPVAPAVPRAAAPPAEIPKVDPDDPNRFAVASFGNVRNLGGGISKTFTAKFLPTGEKVKIKTSSPPVHREIADGADGLKREAATSEVAVMWNDIFPKKLNVNVPLTVWVDPGPPVEGYTRYAVSGWAEGKHWDRMKSLEAMFSKDQVRAAALFDSVTGQGDRHANNFLYEDIGGERKLHLIDHNLSFPKRNKNNYFHNRTFLNASTAALGPRTIKADELAALEKLRAARAELDARMDGLLDRQSRDAMWERVDWMIAHKRIPNADQFNIGFNVSPPMDPKEIKKKIMEWEKAYLIKDVKPRRAGGVNVYFKDPGPGYNEQYAKNIADFLGMNYKFRGGVPERWVIAPRNDI